MRKLNSPYVVDIRGKGLWIGIELNKAARPFCEALKERGVLCKETHESVIRLAPPLVISKEDLDLGLTEIGKVLEERSFGTVIKRSAQVEAAITPPAAASAL